MLMLIRRKPLEVYVLLTFILSWSLWYFSGALSEVTINFKPLGHRWILAQAGTFIPAILGGIFTLVISANRFQSKPLPWITYALIAILGIAISFNNYENLFRIQPLMAGILMVALLSIFTFTKHNSELISSMFKSDQVSIWWIFASVFAFPSLMLAAMMIKDGGVTIAQHDRSQGAIMSLVSFAIFLFTFNLLFGGSIGEEPGWRGFALPLLIQKHGAFMASIILGVIWALWHAPLDIAHGFLLNGWLSVVARIFWTIPLSLLFTYFFMKTNGSILIAILIHTSINMTFDFFQPSDGAVGVFALGVGILSAVAYII